MPGKKSSKPRVTNSIGQSASAFVRTLPTSMKAKEVVEEAAKAGFKISTGLVYVARQASRKGNPTKGKPGRKPRAVSSNGSGVADFKRAALDLGIANARAALDDLEQGLARLIG